MLALVRRCVDENDNEAWGELFELVDHEGIGPIRRLLTQCGISATEAEEVVMEILEYLYQDKNRLRSFRGEDGRQFRKWLRQVSINFTRNWIAARISAWRRERAALAEFRPLDRDGLTEEQLLARLAELEGVLTTEEFARLQMLFQHEPADIPVSPRTRRHWVHELLKKSADCL